MSELTDAASTARPRRKGNALNWLIGLFFGVAALCAAAPVLAAPVTAASLMLLVGLAGVACLGLLALRNPAEPAGDPELSPEALLDALPEPTALAAADGRIHACNGAWRGSVGMAPRLPKNGASGTGLFAALSAARRGETGRATLKIGGGDRVAEITPAGPRRFLVRLLDAAPEPMRLPAKALEVLAAVATASPPPPKVLDAFAAASPFGAALLEGEDPFEATIVEANPALAAVAGGGAPGQAFGELIEPSSRADAAQKLKDGVQGALEVRLACDPTRIAHLYLAKSEGRWVAYLVDVSAQKQIELQLAQSQKMQAIGQLAGGVAHDFNNLLTAIFMQLDVLAARHPVGDPSYEGLNEIRQTSARAADLVRKLLAFSRKQTVQREVLDLGELISEFEVLLRRVLYEDVKLETEYGRDLPQVKADRSQLETAVMNLAVNARDAVRAHGGGTVSIRTARLTESQARAMGFPGARGDQALIEVADDGPGIPPEVIDKIFDPFFTTKPVGEGTGLGLATVYGIVKQSDGWITVHSRPGEGAAFRIFLQVHAAPAEVQAVPAPAKARPVARDLSGAGKILFVEDEDAVRGVAAKLLRARGYEVIEAGSGEEALELAEQHAGEIDLMISDVVMPGMQGPDLLKHARLYLGEAPVMFISGYAESEFSDLLEGEKNISFLPKPIDIKTLAERVKLELQKAA
ncbi:MAG: ATP-binding protein [Phenylobacterium sp.]|jgi:two-component system cell cycle sensor histidine kinase/response regulator CckA|uniref:cell cycle histidine kinase CckA n=1 Tax=Phenylobacterium sp. TaxID=1871053 RepID=UPI002A36A24D|nr:ATP-binding protein [Phenylobacterium sp.]MDX9999042.1 ATP-binding protein [Phenylobacterium sp.]